MFLRQITEAFLVRTEPDSSIVKPAHIHITSAPQMRNEKVLKTNPDSASTDADAGTANNASAQAAAPLQRDHADERLRFICLPRLGWPPHDTTKAQR